MNRVAMIGLDAMEPTLVDRMIGRGELPNLARLRAEGAVCQLKSEATWRSGRVWETLLSGEADFSSATEYDPRKYTSHQIGARRKRPFYADVPDVNLVAIDVPYLSFHHDVPGARVIWGGHDAGYPRASQPQGLVRKFDEKYGVHPAFFNDFGCPFHHAPSVNVLADALVEGSRRRCDIARDLLQEFPDWNLFMTVLSEPHSAGEVFWHGLAEDHPLTAAPTRTLATDRLHEVYREVDRAIGRLIECFPAGTTVVVCTLHGMELNHYDVPSMVLLPELLYRASFGRKMLHATNGRAWRKAGCPIIVPESWEKWNDYLMACRGESTWEWFRHQFRRTSRRLRRPDRKIERLSVPILPETELSPEEIGVPRESIEWQVTCWYRKYWPKMRAFAVPVFYDGRVRINLEQREADGIVPQSEYAAACDWVEQLLSECRNPRTGGPVVQEIQRTRTHDFTSLDGQDSDLVVVWEPGIDALEHPRHGMIGPFPWRRTGGHTDRGFAYFVGAGIAAGDYGQQEALDMTPTLQALMGHVTNGRTVLPGFSRVA